MKTRLKKIARPLGLLFEIAVFSYLKSKQLHDIDQTGTGIEQQRQGYIEEITYELGASLDLVTQMIRVHARDLGEQIITKTSKLLGCADLIWFSGGNTSYEKQTTADIYVGCSTTADPRGPAGFSLKFQSETRMHVASLTPDTTLQLLVGSKRVQKYKKKYGIDEIEDYKEWAVAVAEMIHDAASFKESPTKFIRILNYLLTRNKFVFPAVRNYASPDLGGADWSKNIRKDFFISKSSVLKSKPGASVSTTSTPTYVKMTYMVPNGSHSGTSISFWPRDGVVGIRVNNLASSRR